MSVVIVGAGHAGIEAADALRREGYEGAVTVVDASPHQPYQRPPLSKDFVEPGADASPLPLRAERFYADHDVELRLGKAAVAVDPVHQVVTLDDGANVDYEFLVLATGAHGRLPGCEGAELAGVHQLRTLDDAQALSAALADATRVVVVGAGFIGLEFASAAEKRGLPVTVLERAARPMQRVLSVPMSEHFSELHEGAGAALVFGESLAALEGEGGRVEAVVGTSGRRYEADLVVLGLGIVPAVEIARRAGLAVDDGIVVDAHLRTSDKHVFAVGDCASFPSVQARRRLRLESVQNATEQGRCVAKAIVGRPEPYAAVPWFWTVQCAQKLQIAGLPSTTMSTVLCGDLAAGKASVLGFEHGRLVSVESIGSPADHMAARKLLASECALSPEMAAAEEFTLKAYAKARPAAT